MRLGLFSPYSISTAESPALWLLGSGLPEFGHEMLQIKCDGCFSVCDRALSPQQGFGRKFSECFACSRDQSFLSERLNTKILKLSSLLTPDELVLSKRWAQTFEMSNVKDLAIEGENLLWLCRSSLKNRFGTIEAALRIPEIENSLREMFLSTIRTISAARKFSRTSNCDLLLVSGRDFLAESFALGAKLEEIPTARFIWDPKSSLLNIAHPYKNEVLTQDITGIDLRSLLGNPQNWPESANELLKEMMQFLEIPSSQMVLFAAN